MNKLLFLVLTVLALLTSVPQVVLADDELVRTVSVSADAEVKTSPDKVDVMLGISERSRKLEDAKQATDEQLKALFRIAKEMNIDEKDMQTTYSSVQPEYRYEEKTRRQVMEGYRITHNVKVTIKDMNSLGKFIDSALNAKIDEIQNVVYGIQNEDKFKEEALVLAIAKAKSKATAMAAAADAEVGAVVTLTEAGAIAPPMPIMKRGGMRIEAMSMAADAGSPVPPSGEMTVRANVSVTYELNN